MERNFGETWNKTYTKAERLIKAYFDTDAGTCPEDASNLRFDDKRLAATSRAEIYRYNDTGRKLALMHQFEDGLPGLALGFRNRLAGENAVVGVDAILQTGVGLNGSLGT